MPSKCSKSLSFRISFLYLPSNNFSKKYPFRYISSYDEILCTLFTTIVIINICHKTFESGTQPVQIVVETHFQYYSRFSLIWLDGNPVLAALRRGGRASTFVSEANRLYENCVSNISWGQPSITNGVGT